MSTSSTKAKKRMIKSGLGRSKDVRWFASYSMTNVERICNCKLGALRGPISRKEAFQESKSLSVILDWNDNDMLLRTDVGGATTW
jgi:hypothetical protein